MEYIPSLLSWWYAKVDQAHQVPPPPNIVIRTYLKVKLRLWEVRDLPRTMDELDGWIANAIDQRIITANNCPELFLSTSRKTADANKCH